MTFGAIVIGRNEGERLICCLRSLSSAVAVVYVDSGSSDGSVQTARDLGVDVIELDNAVPFTAARARNAGFRHLRKISFALAYVQFVDGDCELSNGWPQAAVSFLNEHAEVGVVSGRLRERYPERSIYNWMCDREWDRPTGDVRECGGIAMMRSTAFEAVHGYRDDLIAGEEPELCVRLRAAGWRIWRLNRTMALHDANIMRFSQWWRRSTRTGYSFAEGVYLHGSSPEQHRVWESRRAWLWGLFVPVVCIASVMIFGPWGWAVWSIYLLQLLRQTIRNRGHLRERAVLAFFQVLIRFPESLGQIKFMRDRLVGRKTRLIEYK